MTTSIKSHDNHLLQWMAAAFLLLLFGFGDTAIVAVAASLVTFGQLAAVSAAFLLIAVGLIFTAWQIRRVR